MARRKRKDKNQAETDGEVPVDSARTVDADEMADEAAAGGLAVYERDGTLLHVTPPDVANSLRFFVSKLQQIDDVATRSTLAITSALEGEGVTSVARSLAAVIAHDLDRSVCLVETNWWLTYIDDGANWWRTPEDDDPSRHPGLADVLRGSCSVETALVRTSDERLSVLPAGSLPVAERAAVASSPGFADALDLLGKLFDIVVVDAPPLLKASEATTIVRHADAAVLVVRQAVTTEQQVKTAIEELGNTELLGVIMNRWSTHVPKFFQRFALPT